MTLSTIIAPDELTAVASDLLNEEASVLADDANRASFVTVQIKQQTFYTQQVRARAQAIASRDDFMSEDRQQKAHVLRALEDASGDITPIHIAIHHSQELNRLSESVAIAKDKIIDEYHALVHQLQQINTPETQQQYTTLVATYTLLKKQLVMAREQKNLFAYNAAYLALKQFSLSDSFVTFSAYFFNLALLQDNFINDYVDGVSYFKKLHTDAYTPAKERVIKSNIALNKLADEGLSPAEKKQKQARSDALLAANIPFKKLELAIHKTDSQLKKYSGAAAKSDEAVQLREQLKALEEQMRPVQAVYEQLKKNNQDLDALEKSKRVEAEFLTAEKAQLAHLLACRETFEREVSDGIGQINMAGIALTDTQAIKNFFDDIASLSSNVVKERYHFNAVKTALGGKAFVESVAGFSQQAVRFIEERVIDPAKYLHDSAKELNEGELKAFRVEQIELFNVNALFYLQNDQGHLRAQYHELTKTLNALLRKTHESPSALTTKLAELQRLKAQLLAVTDASQQIDATFLKKQQKLQQVLTQPCFQPYADSHSEAVQLLMERVLQAQSSLNTQQQEVLAAMNATEKSLFVQFEQFSHELTTVYLGDYYQERAKAEVLQLTNAMTSIDGALAQIPTFHDFKQLNKTRDSLQILIARGEVVIDELNQKHAELLNHQDFIEHYYPEKGTLLAELKNQSRLLTTVKAQQFVNQDQAHIASAKAQKHANAFMAFTFNDLSLLLTSLQVDDFFAACKRHLSLEYLLTLHDASLQGNSTFQPAQKAAEATDKLIQVDDVLVRLTLLIEQADTHTQPQLQALQEKYQVAAQKLKLIVANDSAAIIHYGQAQRVHFDSFMTRDQALLQLKADLQAPSIGRHSVPATKAFYQEDQRFLTDVYQVINAAHARAALDAMAPEIAMLTFNDQLIDRIDQEIRTATSNDLAVIRLDRWLQVLAMAKDEGDTALWQVLHTGILQATRSMPELIAALPSAQAVSEEDMLMSAAATVTAQKKVVVTPPTSVRQVELQQELFPVNAASNGKDQRLVGVIKKALLALDGVEVVAATIDGWFKASVANVDMTPLSRLDKNVDHTALAAVFEPLATISNQLSVAVYASVLHTPNPAKRMALLEQWLNVLNELKVEENYHAIEAILTACHRLAADKLIPFDCQKDLARATEDHSKHQYALKAYLAAPSSSQNPLVNCPSFASIHQWLLLQSEKLETPVAEWQVVQQRLQQVQVALQPSPENSQHANVWQANSRQANAWQPNALSQTLAQLTPDFNQQRQALSSMHARKLVNADQCADRLAAAPASTFFQDGVLNSYRTAAFSADQRYTAQSALIQNAALYELILKKHWVLNIDAKVADYDALNRCLLQNPSAAQLKRVLAKIVLDPLTKADLHTVLAANQQTYYHSLIENSVLRDCVKGRVLKSTSYELLQWLSSSRFGTENKLLALNKATHQAMDTAAFKTLLADVGIYLTPSELTRVVAENTLLLEARKLATHQAATVIEQSAAPVTLADAEPNRLARWSKAVKANPVKAAAIGAAACVFFKPALVVGAVLGGIEAFRAQELVVDEQRPHGP